MSGKELEAVAQSVAVTAGAEARYGLRFISHEAWRMLLAFLAVVLPLVGFAALVEELREDGVFFFDAPLMLALHKLASPGIDAFFVTVSKLGYTWGVVPIDALVLFFLAWRRHYRDGLFFGLAVIGSLLVNMAAKSYFTRFRPELWLSVAPEHTYSFPSGHAMGSMTLGLAVLLLAWPTRWRGLVLVAALAFVLLVGLSRIYLGVHWPSDILAGWSAAAAWVLAMYWLVAARAPPPPSPAAAPAARDSIEESKTAQTAVAEGKKAAG